MHARFQNANKIFMYNIIYWPELSKNITQLFPSLAKKLCPHIAKLHSLTLMIDMYKFHKNSSRNY